VFILSTQSKDISKFVLLDKQATKLSKRTSMDVQRFPQFLTRELVVLAMDYHEIAVQMANDQ
jgi:hypothetical protein